MRHTRLYVEFIQLLPKVNRLERLWSDQSIKTKDIGLEYLDRIYHRYDDALTSKLKYVCFGRSDADIAAEFFLSESIDLIENVEESDNIISHFRYMLSKYFYNLYCYCLVHKGLYGSIKGNISSYLLCIKEPEYPTLIKKLRNYCLTSHMSVGTHELNAEILEEILELGLPTPINPKDFSDYDDILHEDFLMNHRIDGEDYLLAFEEPLPTTEEKMNCFRQALREVLMEIGEIGFDLPKPEELMRNASDSNSYSPVHSRKKNKMVKKRVALRKNLEGLRRKTFLNRTPAVYSRNVVYVSPANARDTWVPTLDTYLRNQYYDLRKGWLQ